MAKRAFLFFCFGFGFRRRGEANDHTTDKNSFSVVVSAFAIFNGMGF